MPWPGPTCALRRSGPLAVAGAWLALRRRGARRWPALLAERLLIARTGSVSDRLWRLILAARIEPTADGDPADAERGRRRALAGGDAGRGLADRARHRPEVHVKVYIIGAGPGDPGLLTLRGAELIARCPVVLYTGLAGAAARWWRGRGPTRACWTRRA